VVLDTGTPYLLPYPQDSDVANVPLHMQRLAEKLEEALNGKVGSSSLAAYQTKIKIQATPPAATAPGTDGDIIFVV
jgi:hypothetical protein